MRHPGIVRGCWFALSSLCLIGCSSPSTIEGTVKFDGKPVDGGKITFSKKGEKARTNIVSGPITNGSYSVKSNDLPAGAYLVEIYWYKKTGKKVDSSDLPEKVDETIQVIPPHYSTNSNHTVELKPGANTHNFDVKSPGPRDKNN